MNKNFEVNKLNGELKVFTENGFFLVKPFDEGISIELYDKNITDGYISKKINDIPSVDLAIMQINEGKCYTYLWEDTSNEEPSVTIEHKIEFEY